MLDPFPRPRISEVYRSPGRLPSRRGSGATRLASPFSIALTTAASEAKAREIAKAALEARLAACAQLFPIQSLYVWKDELREDAEIALHLKIRAEDFPGAASLDPPAARLRDAGNLENRHRRGRRRLFGLDGRLSAEVSGAREIAGTRQSPSSDPCFARATFSRKREKGRAFVFMMRVIYRN